jgi:hypothetical protein
MPEGRYYTRITVATIRLYRILEIQVHYQEITNGRRATSGAHIIPGLYLGRYPLSERLLALGSIGWLHNRNLMWSLGAVMRSLSKRVD